MIDDGHSKYLQEEVDWIDLELLNARIEFERKDEILADELRDSFLDTKRMKEIQKERENFHMYRREGFYDGKGMYNNSEIKEIKNKIWYKK